MGGANFGLHTIPMAKCMKSGRVISFDPVPELTHILCALAEKNNVLDKCIIRNQALGSRFSRKKFFYFKNLFDKFDISNSVFSSIIPPDDHIKNMKYDVIHVDVVTIDSVVEELGLNVKFMKLDIEGGEFDALVGASSLLKNQMPLVIFEDSGPSAAQRYGYSDRDFLGLFLTLGYNLYYITGHVVDIEDWIYRNYEDRWRPINIIAVPCGGVSCKDLRVIIDSVYMENNIEPLWRRF